MLLIGLVNTEPSPARDIRLCGFAANLQCADAVAPGSIVHGAGGAAAASDPPQLLPGSSATAGVPQPRL